MKIPRLRAESHKYEGRDGYQQHRKIGGINKFRQNRLAHIFAKIAFDGNEHPALNVQGREMLEACHKIHQMKKGWVRISVFLLLSLAWNTNSIAQRPTELIADRLAYLDDAIQVVSFSNDSNEDRLLILCQNGKIWVYEDGVVLDEPFFDIGENGLDIVDFGIGSEEGLLSITLDPNYEENGFFYLMYNGYRPDGTGTNLYDEHLVCFRRSADDEYKADTDWWYEVLYIEMPRRGHNGGAVFFGQDGYLYCSIGDGGSTGSGQTGGGSGGDADNNAQSLDTILGKVLRIGVNGDTPYTIPTNNPFVGVENAREEIWAYGLRNPWRWSFDSITGDMYIGDVGEVDWEEVSFGESGVGGINYGWRLLEGNACYEPVENCDPDGITQLPAYDYFHNGNLCSVIGGFVYRGQEIPSLYGYYIYSDACGFADEKFWLLWNDGTGWQNEPVEVIVDGGFQPWIETRLGFGQDNQGNLYICTRLAVYKIAADPNYTAPSDTKDTALKFVPNPAYNETILDLGGNFVLDRMQVYNAQGKLMNEYGGSTGVRAYRIDISGYPSGVYSVRVTCEGSDEVRTGKFVVADWVD